jgi:hypothetical protein
MIKKTGIYEIFNVYMDNTASEGYHFNKTIFKTRASAGTYRTAVMIKKREAHNKSIK